MLLYKVNKKCAFFMDSLYSNRTFCSRETIVAIFIISLFSGSIFSGFAFGFSSALFLLFGGIVGACSFLYPRSGIYATVFLLVVFERFYTLQPLLIGKETYHVYPLDIVVAAIFFRVFLELLSKRIRLSLTIPMGFLLAFFVYVSFRFGFDILNSSDRSLSVAFSTWKNYVFYGGIAMLTAILFQMKEHIFRFSRFLCAGILVIFIFLAIGIMRGEGLWTEYTPLSTSGHRILAFPHAFYFSIAFLIGTVLFIHLRRSLRGVWRCVFLFAYPALLIGILGSLMRHLWLGIFVALISSMILFRKETLLSMWSILRTYALVTVLFVSLSCTVFLVLSSVAPSTESTQIFKVLGERLTSLGNASDTSIAWRGVVWKNAFNEFSGNPIFGTGFGNRVSVEMDGYQDYVEIRNMHNSWLALLVQSGIFGFSLLVLFLGSLLVRVVHVSRRWAVPDSFKLMEIALSTILIFCSIVFFSQPYLETNLLSLVFWVSSGLLLGIDSVYQQAIRSKIKMFV